MALQDDNFRDFLARRYSRRPAVISIVEQPTINLSEAELPNEGSTQDLWHAVLRLTKQMDTFDDLIVEVRRQYEKEAELIDKLAEAWLKGKESAPAAVNMRNPYPGLRPFEEADHDLFYGRERWIADLSKALDDFGFVTLYGGSGSGKSSLLRAGLMPKLKRAGHAVVLFTPGKNPFDSLLSMGLGNRAQAQSLVEAAQNGQLPGLFTELAAKCYSGQPLLVIMDQGEELFTRCESPEVRETFLKCLFHARSQSPRILIGIREDFFDRWNKTRAHAPDFGATNLSLTAPDEGDWRAIILDPARKHGVIFQAGLPEVMIERLRVARAGLPLLQFLLQKLWVHDKPEDGVLNQESYDSLGGIDHALRGHVEDFLARFPGREGVIRQMLFKLVRFTRQDGQYRALSRSCPPQELPKDLTTAMMSDEWRILTTRGQAGEVEFSHEVLLRVWPGFEKLEQQRGALHALKGDITDATARWQPEKQKSELWAGSRLEESLKRAGLPAVNGSPAQTDDFALAETPLSDAERDFLETSRAQVIADHQRQKRFLIGATITAIVMLLIAAGAAWFWKKAEEQTVIADEQKTKAKQEESRAKQLTVKAASALGSDSALEVMRTMAQNPELVQEWEGRFLAKRFGFAPMKLQRDEIGILDQGPLKGSGLYQAAIDLYAGKGAVDQEKPFQSQGIAFKGSRILDVTQDEGNIPLLTVAAYKYGGFTHLWLAPDRSCFLGRANGLSVKSFELPHADQESEDLAPDEIYLFPLLERYSCSALQSQPPEGAAPPANGEVPSTPTFHFLKLEAGGHRHLFVHDEGGEVEKRFFLRFGNTVTNERSAIELIPQPQGELSTLVERLRLSIPKEKLAAFDEWIADGASIRCADWSKQEIEVGAYFDGHFLVGPATAPEKMKKLKMPNSNATALWDNGDSSSRSLFLDFSADGKHLLAYPFQNEQIAVINRDSLNIERLISGPKGRIFEYVEPGRSWVHLGSSSKGSLIWASTVFKTDSESLLFRSGSELPIGKTGSATLMLDVDSTERFFAQSMRLSSQIILRDGFNGTSIATVSAEVAGRDDLIRESPQAAGLMLLGDTLLRTEGHSESMQLPKGITLAPDWSWAAYLEKGSEAETEYNGDIPYLRIIRGLNGPTTALTTLADKARDYQLHWFSSSTTREQLQVSLSQTFEAREAALFKRLAWPKNLPMITLAEFETLSKKSPEIFAEAQALLKERPGSSTAQFIKVAAGFLATGNVDEAVRELEAKIVKTEDMWSFEEFNLPWEEMTNYVAAKGGRFPEKLSLPNTSTLWMILRNLRSGKPDAEEGISYLDGEDKLTLLAQMLVHCHQARTAGDKEASHQGLACIRLIMSPPAWFTASVQSRSLVRDPASMPMWLSLCPEEFRTSLDQMFQTLPADQDIAQASLKLVQALFEHEGKRQIAEQLTQMIQSKPGLELKAADLLIQHGVKIEGANIRLPEDAPVEYTLAWLGRLALVHYDATRQKADAAKFAQLRAGRTLEQLTDKELRGYLCLLLANLGYDEPAGPKWDAANAVLTLLQTRQPELLDPEKLKSTSWTADEEFAIGRLLDGPQKK